MIYVIHVYHINGMRFRDDIWSIAEPRFAL
jgi:hypothetical protein